MFTAIASLVLAQSFTLEPTDDVWVYMHAQDQASDPFLRAWGTEGDATGEGASYSVLKFDLSSIPAGEIISAKLILTSPGDIAFIREDSEKAPLQIRMATAQFEEENFSFGSVDKIKPSGKAEAIFATGVVIPSADQKDFKVEINLLSKEGKFIAELTKSTKTANKNFGLALTSTLDPAQAGDGGIYKFYSRNNQDAEKRPKLVIELK